MAWFMVDDQLALHRKVCEAGNAAMGLWVRAGSWSMQNLTEGFIPANVLPSIGTKGQAAALVQARLWVKVEGGYRFHEWSTRQLSAEEIAERRRKRAEAGRKGGKASGEARAKPHAEANASPVGEQNGTHVLVRVPSVVTSSGDVTEVDAREPRPQCPRHPENHTGPCHWCQLGREWDERRAGDELDAQRRRRKDRMDAIAACNECDVNGMVETKTGLAHCSHDHQEQVHA